MESEQIKAVNMEYSEQALEEKTIMFIENYYCGARGIISKIFNDYLTNPVYDGYKLVWLAQDYDETMNHFGPWLESDKVWLCVKNGYDYIRFLNTAKYIYTADYLPSFFMKREGQEIYYAPLDILLEKKFYTKAMLWHFASTVNHADHILVEKETPGLLRFTEKYGCNRIVRLFDNDDSKKYQIADAHNIVFISLANTKRGAKNINRFQYLYNIITPLADAYGFTVHWKIPLSLYKRFRDDEVAYSSCENVHSAEKECSTLMRDSDVVVSDNLCDIVSAGKYCEKLIYYADSADDTEKHYISKDVCVTNDFEKLLDLFEMFISDGEKTPEIPDGVKGSLLTDCPKDLKGDDDYRIIEGYAQDVWSKIDPSGEDFVEDGRPEILVMAETCGFPDMVKKFHDLFLKYSDRIRFTVLYRGTWKGSLYDQLSDLGTDISYICRSGTVQCSDADLEKLTNERVGGKKSKKTAETEEGFNNILESEWLRMLGRGGFDYSIGITGTNVFWLNMYDHIPADDHKTFEKEDTAEDTAGQLEKLIKAYLKKKKTASDKRIKDKERSEDKDKDKEKNKEKDKDQAKEKSNKKSTGRNKSSGKNADNSTGKKKSKKADDK